MHIFMVTKLHGITPNTNLLLFELLAATAHCGVVALPNVVPFGVLILPIPVFFLLSEIETLHFLASVATRSLNQVSVVPGACL